MAMGVASDSNKNEYNGLPLWSKGDRCVGLFTLPLSRSDCLENWEPGAYLGLGRLGSCLGR